MMINSQFIMHNGADAVYDLSGRRTRPKGVYIVDGKIRASRLKK